MRAIIVIAIIAIIIALIVGMIDLGHSFWQSALVLIAFFIIGIVWLGIRKILTKYYHKEKQNLSADNSSVDADFTADDLDNSNLMGQNDNVTSQVTPKQSTSTQQDNHNFFD